MRVDYKIGTEENDTSKLQLNILRELNEICLSLNFDLWLR